MTVTFYTFAKKENSTARPSGGTSYSGILRESCDTLNPSVGVDVGQSVNMAAYNYAYIADFSRYYWVNSWTWDAGIWWANMSVDPLATWKTQIGASTNYVLRAAADSNGDVVDTLYPTTCAVSGATQLVSIYGSNVRCVVVGVASNATGASQGATTYYLMPMATFADLANELFDTTTWTDMTFDATTGLSLDGITEPLYKSLFNPMQYIVSAKMFPFAPATLAQSYYATVKVGWWTTQTQAYVVEQRTFAFSRTIDLAAHPQAATRGNYLNKPPYTHTYINIPPFGTFELDGTQIGSQNKIQVQLTLDIMSGIGQLSVVDLPSARTLLKVQATIGVDVALFQSTQNVLGAGTSLGTGIVSAITSGVSLDIGGAISNAANGIIGAVNCMVPHVSGMSCGGNWAAYSSANDSFIEQVFYPIVAEDIATMGRPLCETRTLNTLPGYQLIANPDIAAPCTSSELDAILGYLSSGYFYE